MHSRRITRKSGVEDSQSLDWVLRAARGWKSMPSSRRFESGSYRIDGVVLDD